jgi:hypothetical protein
VKSNSVPGASETAPSSCERQGGLPGLRHLGSHFVGGDRGAQHRDQVFE